MASNIPDQKVAEKAYTIGGVPIIFPYKAYPVQITMMDRIVKCLNKQHNCLLESPTGTGKSLALLCASLAWLKKTTKEFNELEQMLQRSLNTYGVAYPDDPKPVVENAKTSINFEKYRFNSSKPVLENTKTSISFEKYRFNSSKPGVKMLTPKIENVVDCDEKIKVQDQNVSCKSVDSFSAINESSTSLASSSNSASSKNDHSKKRGIIYVDDDDFDDFQPIKRKSSINSKESLNVSTSVLNSESTADSSPKQQMYDNISKPKESIGSKDLKNALADQTNSTIPVKLPKIYFGTRTHKQIDQIIRELKKTPYKNVNMTILSSRERTCVHPKVSRSRNKNEECDELIRREEGPGCRYYINSIRSGCYPPSSAFDLEDFVSSCKRRQVCPYFEARELLHPAEIVFCPYNYLVDPLIRSALNITLKDNVVIMDEAHNIEDSARDSASCSMSVSQLQDALADVLKIGQKIERENSEPYMHIGKVLENVKKFLQNSQDLNDYVTFDSSCKVWSGNDMIALLDYVGLGPDTFPTFLSMYNKITREESEMEKDKDAEVIKLSGKTHICVKNFAVILSYLYKEKPQFYTDYRLVVIRSKSNTDESNISSSQRKSFSSSPYEITINFWCLNPAVAFTDFKDIHSLVVASGTLAPLTSFQSELGIPFHLSLEANHVIESKNLWVGTIGKGPSNNPLLGNYVNASTFIFQDDVGNLVFEVCSLIPHGVLCFLPSYGMLDKLVNRWQITGLWDKLMTKKVVLCEPRRANESFHQTVQDFYVAVKDSECNNNSNSVNGALLLAVCRGKVSEGFDFNDNNARAVITIGIPFPNIKDAQVDLKKKYNDMYSSQRQIVSGNQWYEMQAFRALNQALGRCIRHRNDFGALIIADERFQKYDRYVGALSKWIKKEIKHYPTFFDALSSLNNFAENAGLKKFPEEENF